MLATISLGTPATSSPDGTGHACAERWRRYTATAELVHDGVPLKVPEHNIRVELVAADMSSTGPSLPSLPTPADQRKVLADIFDVTNMTVVMRCVSFCFRIKVLSSEFRRAAATLPRGVGVRETTQLFYVVIWWIDPQTHAETPVAVSKPLEVLAKISTAFKRHASLAKSSKNNRQSSTAAALSLSTSPSSSLSVTPSPPLLGRRKRNVSVINDNDDDETSISCCGGECCARVKRIEVELREVRALCLALQERSDFIDVDSKHLTHHIDASVAHNATLDAGEAAPNGPPTSLSATMPSFATLPSNSAMPSNNNALLSMRTVGDELSFGTGFSYGCGVAAVAPFVTPPTLMPLSASAFATAPSPARNVIPH